MMEFGDAHVFMVEGEEDGEKTVETTVKGLLPFSFGPEDLDEERAPLS